LFSIVTFKRRRRLRDSHRNGIGIRKKPNLIHICTEELIKFIIPNSFSRSIFDFCYVWNVMKLVRARSRFRVQRYHRTVAARLPSFSVVSVFNDSSVVAICREVKATPVYRGAAALPRNFGQDTSPPANLCGRSV